MSYKCGLCGETSQPHEKATRVITETRVKQYPFREAAHHYRNLTGGKVIKDDPGGVGQEIVKEILICSDCAETRLINKLAEQIN